MLAELTAFLKSMNVRDVRIVRIVRIVLFAAAGGRASRPPRSSSAPWCADSESPATADFDGRFNFCRLVYDGNRNGGSWQTDYPNADINMSIRFSELTKTRVAFYPSGEPKHLLVRATADSLFKCPLVIMTAPGSAIFRPGGGRGAADLSGEGRFPLGR